MDTLNHTLSSTQKEGESWRKVKQQLQWQVAAEVIRVHSLRYLSLLCATLGKGALPLSGGVVAAGMVFMVVF